MLYEIRLAFSFYLFCHVCFSSFCFLCRSSHRRNFAPQAASTPSDRTIQIHQNMVSSNNPFHYTAIFGKNLYANVQVPRILYRNVTLFVAFGGKVSKSQPSNFYPTGAEVRACGSASCRLWMSALHRILYQLEHGSPAKLHLHVLPLPTGNGSLEVGYGFLVQPLQAVLYFLRQRNRSRLCLCRLLQHRFKGCLIANLTAGECLPQSLCPFFRQQLPERSGIRVDVRQLFQQGFRQ